MKRGGAGMQALLKELFSNYHKDVYTYLYSLSRDASLAEDLTSEVFLEVVKSIAAFREESDVKTWLFSIARHRWFAYLRRKNREVRTEALAEFADVRQPPLEEQVQNQLLVQRIYQLLDREPQRTREIVLLRLEGFSFYEIGAKFGISESSARVIDFRAKARLRTILKEEGF